MVKTRLVAISVAMTVLLPVFAARSTATEPDGHSLNVGMVKGMFRDVQPALLQVFSRPFRELMLQQSGYTGEITILPDAFQLADSLKNRQCHLGVFHGFEFAWVKQRHPDLEPLVVTVPPGRKVQACLVVHKDHQAKTLSDIGDECVILPRGTKSHCLLFLEKLRSNLSPQRAMPKTLINKTAEDVLNSVVSCESCCCLVDAAALAGYQALHPGAYKQLRVLSESESFPQSVIAYRKGDLSDTAVAKLKAGLLQAHRSPAGRPLMMLWNLKGFEEVPADYPSQLDAISKSYPAPELPLREQATD